MARSDVVLSSDVGDGDRRGGMNGGSTVNARASTLVTAVFGEKRKSRQRYAGCSGEFMRWMILTAAALLAACSGTSSAGTPTPEPDSGTPVADGGTGDAGPGVDPFAEIDAKIEAARLTQPGPPGVAIAIYDANDVRVHLRTFGDFAPDRRVAVASASKIVSAVVLLHLVSVGTLSLDATTGTVLGWPAGKDSITLRHLLSVTSGLAPANLCTFQAGTTLAACVDTIRDAAIARPPGTSFDYGSTHLHVAARMAEVVTGKTWNALFRETLGEPLGLPPEVTFFTAPKQAIGTTNPLPAGGMRASMDEYAKLLAVVFHSGSFAGKTFATPALFDDQAKEPFPGVVIGGSPAQNAGHPFRYGFGAWLECTTPATGCTKISSPGAFGFTPWVDRSARYYAILGMELDRTGEGVVNFAIDLEQEIQPLIAKAIAGR